MSDRSDRTDGEYVTISRADLDRLRDQGQSRTRVVVRLEPDRYGGGGEVQGVEAGSYELILGQSAAALADGLVSDTGYDLGVLIGVGLSMYRECVDAGQFLPASRAARRRPTATYRVAEEIATGQWGYIDGRGEIRHWTGPSPSAAPDFKAGEPLRAGQVAWVDKENWLWSSPDCGMGREGKTGPAPDERSASGPPPGRDDAHTIRAKSVATLKSREVTPTPPVVMPVGSAGVSMSRTVVFSDHTRTTSAVVWRTDTGAPLDDLGELAWRALNGDRADESDDPDGVVDGAHAATVVDEGWDDWIRGMTEGGPP